MVLLALFVSQYSFAQCVPGMTGSGETCQDPIDLCSGSIPVSTSGFLPDPPLTFCGGTATTENNSWVQFVASATTVSFFYNVTTCANGNGVQAVIYSAVGGDCSNLVELACFNSGGTMQNFTVSANVVPGQTYLLMTDGYAGDQCNFTVTPTGVNLNPPPPPAPIISGPLGVCSGDIVTYTVTNPSPSATYVWYQPPNAGNGITTSIDFTNQSGNIQLCVEASVPCNPACTCITIMVETPPQPFVQPFTTCNDDGAGNSILPYNLQLNINDFLSGLPVGATVNFYASLFAAQNGSPTANPIINVPGCHTFYYDVSTVSGCTSVPNSQPIQICIEDPTAQAFTNSNIFCEGECIDLTTEVNIIETSGSVMGGYTVTFHPDQFAAQTGFPQIYPPVAKADDGINPYWIRLETANGCVDVQPILITFDPVPMLVITDPAPICESFPTIYDLQDLEDDQNVLIVGSPGAALHWYTDEFSAQQGFNELFNLNVNIPGPGSYCYWVTAESTNGCLSPPEKVTIVFVQGPTVEIDGSGDVCLGDDIELNFTFTGVAPFDYTVEDNHGNVWNFTSPDLTATELIQSTTVGTCVFTVTSLTDDSGTNCQVTTIGSATIEVHALPTATITGDATICSGGCTDITFNMTGTGPYEIVYFDSGLNANVTLTGINDGHVISVCPNGPSTYSLVSIEDNLGCFNGNLNSSVIVGILPDFNISNLNEDCVANQYAVEFEINGGALPYSVWGTPGSFLTDSTWMSNLIATLTPYSIFVTDANMCDTINLVGVVDTCCETRAGEMGIAILDACDGDCVTASYDNTNEFLDGDDVLQFILHDSPNSTIGNILATSATPDFCYMAGVTMLETTYYISAIAGNNDGSGNVDQSDQCLDVAWGQPVIWHERPTASIQQSGAICVGDDYTFQVSFTPPGRSSYTFIYTDGVVNDTITSTSSPFNLTVNPTMTTTYTLLEVNDEYCPGTILNSSIDLTVHQIPTNTIPTYFCDLTNSLYAGSFDISGGAGSGNYILVSGPGSITDSTYTVMNVPTGDTISVTYTDINRCDTIQVDMSFICVCTTEAGDMNPDTLHFCVDEVATAIHDNTNTILDGNDILEFVLHQLPDTILGNIVDRGPNPSFAFIPGTMTVETVYYISAVAGNGNGGIVDPNDPCLDVAPGQPVIFHALPTADIANMASEICKGDSVDLTIDLTGVAPFTVVYTADNVAQPALNTNTNQLVVTVSPMSTTTYGLIAVSDVNCDGTVAGSVVITVNEPPTFANLATLCNEYDRTYEASFDILGGEGPFTLVSGPGSINGSQYVSGSLMNNSMNTVEFTDVNMCDTITVMFNENCDCFSNAGTMSTTPLMLCEDELAVGVLPGNDFNTDSNDGIEFILHTGNGASLGTILQRDPNSPFFGFTGTPMMFGVTYYVSRAVADDSLSYVALLDTCLSIAIGTPVTWYPYPSADIQPSALTLTCDVDMITLDGSGSNGMNGVNYTWTDASLTNMLGSGSTLDVMGAGDVYLIVSDMISSCTDTAMVSIDDIREDPEVNLLSPPNLTCDNPVVNIDGSGSSLGPDFVITWTDENGNPVAPSPANELMLPVSSSGMYTLTIVNITNNCISTGQVTVVADQDLPTANAGRDKSFTCIESIVVLDGSGSSQGSNFAYQWTTINGGTISGDNTLAPNVNVIGSYVLEVRNTISGCLSRDTVLVNNNDAIPEMNILSDSISCFGESDGFIIVDQITGGTPPFSYSINGGPFTPFSGFFNLDVGTYDVVVMDVNGCTDTLETVIYQPIALQVSLGPDITINLGDSVTLNPVIITDRTIDSFNWSTNVVVVGQDATSPTVKPTSTSTYSLTVVNSSGCKSSDAMNVIVSKDRPVYIPNVFSPNNDGLNDRFTIFGDPEAVSGIPILRIYSRWGELVWEKENMELNNELDGWNGIFKGDPLNSAVFVYYAEIEFIDGEVELFKGDVTLAK